MSSPTTLPFTTLDVFTNTPYAGNPLAIVHLPPSSQEITQEQKQRIAKEFNLSETVFLHEGKEDGKGGKEWRIDIFTPDAELPFAGHPTIGSAAFVLALNPDLKSDRTSNSKTGTLVTKAGRIPISLISKGGGEFKVTADVPFDTHLHRGGALSTLLKVGSPVGSGFQLIPEIRSRELKSPLFSIVKGMAFLLVELEDLEMLGRVEMSGTAPDFMGAGVMNKGWSALDEGWREGFVGRYYYVLQKDENGEDVVKVRTRMVEAKMEDPATGSAACALSCYLATKMKRSAKFEIEQGVEMGRRSCIGVEVDVDGEGKVGGVRLSGTAVEVMRGEARV